MTGMTEMTGMTGIIRMTGKSGMICMTKDDWNDYGDWDD